MQLQRGAVYYLHSTSSGNDSQSDFDVYDHPVIYLGDPFQRSPQHAGKHAAVLPITHKQVAHYLPVAQHQQLKLNVEEEEIQLTNPLTEADVYLNLMTFYVLVMELHPYIESSLTEGDWQLLSRHIYTATIICSLDGPPCELSCNKYQTKLTAPVDRSLDSTLRVIEWLRET